MFHPRSREALLLARAAVDVRAVSLLCFPVWLMPLFIPSRAQNGPRLNSVLSQISFSIMSALIKCFIFISGININQITG